MALAHPAEGVRDQGLGSGYRPPPGWQPPSSCACSLVRAFVFINIVASFL
jgi:hypothetical protein